MALINSQNLPTILGILISANGLYMLREVFKNFRLWRKGASDREHDIMTFTVSQLDKCHDELDVALDERDTYRQQVGRRDHVILANGLALPRDTHRSGGTGERSGGGT